MAHYTGSDLYITYGGTELSGDHRNFEVSYTVDLLDASAGDDDSKSYVPSLKDANFRLTILDNGTAGSAVRQALVMGGTGTLEYGPEGTATGKPKYSCPVIVNELRTAYPYAGLVEITVGFQRNGDWVEHYEDMGSTY